MKKAILLLACAMFACCLYAQDIDIRGSVVDEQEQPLTGVSVSLKGHPGTGAVTDINGHFTLRAPAGSTLAFSYIGYDSQTVRVGQHSRNMTVRMAAANTDLNEVVVIGYGTAKRKDLTGSVASVSADKLEETPAVSLNQALQGKSAGVQVNISDNSPGGAINVIIRGQGSINQSNQPIYVVDGVVMEGTLQNINVTDIASIDILKDASAAAIYGSRAANGVVIVTTKRGEAGKPKVTLSARTSFQSPANLPKMLTAQELADVRIEGNVNAQLNSAWLANPSMTIEEYRTQFDQLKAQYWQELPSSMFSDVERQTLLDGKSYDWYDQISHTGITQDYTLALSGGSATGNYYISANYYNQRGIIRGTNHRRYSFRVNLEQQLKSWLKVGVNSVYYDGKTETGGASIGNALAANPMYPFKVDGEDPLTLPFYTSPGQSNPILSEQIDNDSKSHRFSMNAYLQVDFFKDLNWRTSFLLDQVNNFSGYYAPSNINQGKSVSGEAQIVNQRWTDFTWENSINYTHLFARLHRVTAMVGNTLQENNYFGNTQYGSGFATNVMGYNNIGAASLFPASRQGSSKTKWAMASFIGRVNYAFDDKYIVTATGRYDGNSKYGDHHKWGFFPSFAGAWRISAEQFMKPLTWLDDMKLRVGWGQSGNSTVAAYSSFTTLSPGTTVDYQNNTVNTIQNSDQFMGNKDLKWERQEQVNVGLDLTAFRSRLRFTIDLYKKNSKDLVLQTPLPSTTGYLNIWSNVGELENKGIEISIGGRIISTRDFSWDLDANWTHNKNKLKKLYGGLTEKMNDASNPLGAGWWVGKPLGTIYTYRYEGIWQWDDDRTQMDILKDGYEGGDTYYPGENKIADLDDDNQITTADREIVGYTDPKGYGGFSTTLRWRNLSLNAAFTYVYGNDIFNRSYHEYTLGAGYGFLNLMEDEKNRWSVNNTSGTIPRANSNNLDRMLVSSRLVQSGSFLRMKNITLNYSFPKAWISRIGLSSLDFYISGENLLTVTGYKGADPESPGTGYDETYPLAKSFTMGLNVTF